MPNSTQLSLITRFRSSYLRRPSLGHMNFSEWTMPTPRSLRSIGSQKSVSLYAFAAGNYAILLIESTLRNELALASY